MAEEGEVLNGSGGADRDLRATEEVVDGGQFSVGGVAGSAVTTKRVVTTGAREPHVSVRISGTAIDRSSGKTSLAGNARAATTAQQGTTTAAPNVEGRHAQSAPSSASQSLPPSIPQSSAHSKTTNASVQQEVVQQHDVPLLSLRVRSRGSATPWDEGEGGRGTTVAASASVSLEDVHRVPSSSRYCSSVRTVLRDEQTTSSSPLESQHSEGELRTNHLRSNGGARATRPPPREKSLGGNMTNYIRSATSSAASSRTSSKARHHAGESVSRPEQERLLGRKEAGEDGGSHGSSPGAVHIVVRSTVSSPSSPSSPVTAQIRSISRRIQLRLSEAGVGGGDHQKGGTSCASAPSTNTYRERNKGWDETRLTQNNPPRKTASRTTQTPEATSAKPSLTEEFLEFRRKRSGE